MGEELRQAVAGVWDAFGERRVSAVLEVCLCPVCMSEETRARIVATPPRALTASLVREYSNSAHGVPADTDDLKALLPRYLELLASGEEVDYTAVGCELLRFGDAWRQDGTLFSAPERAALDAWMRAFAARTQEPAYTLDMLMAGPWGAAEVTAALDALFDAPGTGAASLARFANGLVEGAMPLGGLYAIGHAGLAEREAVARWLGGEGMVARLVSADAAVPEEERWGILALFDLAGQVRVEMLPAHP